MAEALEATTARGCEPTRRPRTSWTRVAVFSVIGSAVMIVATLAARPDPISPVEAHVDAVLELYGKGDRQGAWAASAAAVAADPKDPRGWLLQGMLHEDRSDLDDAIRAYGHGRDLLQSGDARCTDVDITLADLLRRKGNPKEALLAIEKVARERGESTRIRHARTLALIDLGRFEDALSETRLIAEEKFGGGVAKKLEQHIRSLMAARAARDG